MGSTTLIAGAVFIAVLFLVEGLYYLAGDLRQGREKTAINRRLRLLAGGKTSQEVMLTLLRRPEKKGLAAWMAAELPPVAALDILISKAGASIPVERLLLWMMAGFVLTLLAGMQIALLSPLNAALLATFLAFAVPVAVLYRRGGARLKRFSIQLADAVDMIARSLKAGHPVPTAIGQVAREMPDPIGSEFGLVYDEMTYGMDLREALDNLAKRVPIADLQYMVLSVRIQYGTGGNLAEVLGALGKLVRERVRLAHKIKALSAEGRISAIVLTALPLVVVGIINAVAPDYYGEVWNKPAFHKAMGMAAGSVITGIVVMYKMINFRV